MTYRAGEDVEARVRRVVASARRRSARIAEAYWELLEVDVPGLRHLAGAYETELETRPAEELEAAVIALDELLAEAIALAPARRAELMTVPDEMPRSSLRRTWSVEEGVSFAAADYRDRARPGAGLLDRVARCLGELDPSVTVEHHGGAFRADSMQIRGAPFAVEIAPTVLSEDMEVTVATAVPAALAPIRLQRMTFLHTMTTAVRLQTDTPVGDSTFDDHFLVEASPVAARRLLDEPLRTALMRLAVFVTPRLVVGDGLATLSFRYVFSPMLVERAVDILLAVRGRDVDVKLLR